jgi:hypothetical protein
MRKVSVLLPAFLSVLVLASCGETSSSLSSKASSAVSSAASSSVSSEAAKDLVLASPKGSPALAALAVSGKEGSHVTAKVEAPTNVIAEFTSAASDVVFFDLTKGCTFIEAKNSPYKLLSVLTAGNAFVVSTGHDANSTIDATDSIVSFGKNSLFTSIFKTIYGVTDVAEVADVSTAYSVAVTGKNAGADVDYVILSEPFVSKAVAANTSLTLKCNLATEFKTWSAGKGYNGGQGYNGFPQAGVFIKAADDADASYASSIKSFTASLKAVSQDIAANNAVESLKTINAEIESGKLTSDEATADLGMSVSDLGKTLSSATNVLGLANPFAYSYENYDVNGFFTEAALTGYAAYKASTFSSYYVA